MIRAPLFAIALSSVSYAACAQPANGTAAGLESCSQLARAAATVCYNQTDSGVERFDCRQARATLGECLESIARSAPLETPEGTGSSEMSSGTIPQKLRPPTVSPNNSTNTGSLSPPYRAVPSKKPSVAVSPDKPTGTVASEKPAAADLIGPRSANENMTGLNLAFTQRVSPTRSVLNCRMIRRSDWIASSKLARPNSSAWNTCCPKRPLGPRRQKRLPRQPG